jgi:hypothetical protein
MKSLLNTLFVCLLTISSISLASCCCPPKHGHSTHHNEHSKMHHEHGDK